MSCLICGSDNLEFWAEATDVEYFTTTERFSYYLCGDCSAMSIDPVPDDRLNQIYPANYYSFASANPSLSMRVKTALDRRLFRSILGPMAGQSLSALDVGGGTGWLLGHAKQAEPRLGFTQVVDIDEKAEEAALVAGHAYFCGRIEDFESTRQFDLILLLNLIEHVKDPIAVLSAAGRLLAPGGRILVKTPNHESLDARLFRRSYWGGLHCPRHWVLFTARSLRHTVAASGLVLHELTMTQGGPFWAWSVMHQLHRFGLIRIDGRRPMWAHPVHGPLQAGFAGFDFLRMPFSNGSQMFAILGG